MKLKDDFCHFSIQRYRMRLSRYYRRKNGRKKRKSKEKVGRRDKSLQL
jgi:hypothetical protein